MSAYTSHHHPDQSSFRMRAVIHQISGAVVFIGCASIVVGYFSLILSLNNPEWAGEIGYKIDLSLLLGGLFVALIALLFFKGTEPARC